MDGEGKGLHTTQKDREKLDKSAEDGQVLDIGKFSGCYNQISTQQRATATTV
jgi:hypothetical protein